MSAMSHPRTPPAFVFDLDGTLVDSVYEHVIAWRESFGLVGVELPVWRIHRRIGMGSAQLVRTLLTELDADPSEARVQEVKDHHSRLYDERRGAVTPLPGAVELLAELGRRQVRWAIATSDEAESARRTLELLELGGDVPLLTGDDVDATKPDPEPVLAAADLLEVEPHSCLFVGDSTWDMLAARRAGAFGVGLLCGGFSRAELDQAHAFRVYSEPADLLDHLYELGVPS